jgi:tetrahydromethanopterin:alpha-L-glutamate ligase
MTLRIAIMTEDPGWHGDELRRALEARGADVGFASLRDCSVDLVPGRPRLLVPGFEDRLPDGVIVRGLPGGSQEQVVMRLDLLHALTELGVPVYNHPRAIERTVDKGMTSFLLGHAGLPTPPTSVTESPAQARAFLLSETGAGHEVVAKPLFGSLGVGLRRLKAGMDIPDASECNGVWYLQRFVETARSDADWPAWRVLVVGGAPVAAMVRRGSSWISNVAQGARCERVAVDEELETLAVGAARVVGADCAGVDLVRDREGKLEVLEVNGIPAWRGLQSVSTWDIAACIVEDFLSQRSPGRAAVAC